LTTSKNKTVLLKAGGIIAFTLAFAFSRSAASDDDTGTGQTFTETGPAEESAVDEESALDSVWNLSVLTDFRTEHPDAKLVLMITGTPEEENGRWCINAMTDEGTHYSTVGIYFVDAATGEITSLDIVTGEEIPADNP
jgi:hypothetical protein